MSRIDKLEWKGGSRVLIPFFDALSRGKQRLGKSLGLGACAHVVTSNKLRLCRSVLCLSRYLGTSTY